MAPGYVFIKDIEQALKQGKKEISVPEGMRISAAALDLIQQKGLTLTRPGAGEAVETREDSKEKVPAQGIATVNGDPENGNAGQMESETGAGNRAVSEAEIEEIVNRVIERFNQLKDGKTPPPAKEAAAPAPDDDVIICRCEEITRGEIKEAIRNGMHTLNGIKRVTRAGMGLCQGQTCQRLISQILASELGLPPAEVEPSTSRAPVRPIRLSVFATG